MFCDTASCYDDNGKPVTPDRKKKTRGRLRLKEIGTVETVQGMEIKQKPGSELESESSSLASCPDPIPPLSDLDYDDKLNLVLNIENDYPLQMNQNQTFMVEEPRVAEETESKNDDDDDDDVKETMCEIPLECDNDAATIEDSGFYMDDTSTGSPNQNMGNSLIGKTGWSSSFDEGEEQKCYSSPIQKDDVATLNAKDGI